MIHSSSNLEDRVMLTFLTGAVSFPVALGIVELATHLGLQRGLALALSVVVVTAPVLVLTRADGTSVLTFALGFASASVSTVAFVDVAGRLAQ